MKRNRIHLKTLWCVLTLCWSTTSAGTQTDSAAPPPPADPPVAEPGSGTDAPADTGDADAEQPGVPATGNDGDASGRGFSDQVALITELASAYRLRDELDAALAADGSATAQAGVAIDARLAGLATRCEVLANSATSDLARAVLLRSQARAHAALARIDAPAAEAVRQRRLQQLRASAEKIRGLAVPDAEASADYWQLLADLADASRLNANMQARQSLAEQLLYGYIQAYAQNNAANDYVIDARLSLAELLDDQGDQASAAKHLEAIGELPDDSPRTEQAERLRASVARIGKRVEIEALTTRVTVWKLSDFVGQPVLLHVYADTLEHSVAMIQPIRRAIARGKLGGAAVASLRVGDPVQGAPAAPWPILPVDLEPGGVLDRLGVGALPALVWIDAEGKVAGIGHTEAMLDRMPKQAADEQQTPPDAPTGPPVDAEDAEPAPGDAGDPPAESSEES